MTDEDAANTRFRSPAIAWGVPGAAGATLLAVAWLLSTLPRSASLSGLSWSLVVIGSPGVAEALWLRTCGVDLLPEHALVRCVRRRVVPWRDVQAVVRRPGKRWWLVQLVLDSGKPVTLRAPMLLISMDFGRTRRVAAYEQDYHRIGQWWLAHRGPSWRESLGGAPRDATTEGDPMSGPTNYPGTSAPFAGAPALQKLPAPADVRNSVRLWFASLAVGLVGGILVFATTDQAAAVQKAVNATPSLTSAQAKSTITVSLVSALVGSIIGLGIQLFFVLKLKAGRNWARIVLTVFVGMGVLRSLAAAAMGSSSGLGVVVQVVQVLLGVAAGVFMFRPAANAYFGQKRA